MNLSLVQFDIAKGDTQANLAHLDTLLTCGADVVVLPEMFHCGLPATDADVQRNGGIVLQWMTDKARQINSYVCGSVAVNDCGRVYNRLYCVSPSGDVAYYDKRHLFSMGMEQKFFSAGNRREIVNIGPCRCLLQVCYDLRFPVWSRNLGDYDLIIYVANWPTPRIDAWKTLLKARAIENQCFVVGVNRIGTVDGINYCGSSAVCGPRGEQMAAAQDNVEQVVTTEINLDALARFRQKFQVLNDSDEFKILT